MNRVGRTLLSILTSVLIIITFKITGVFLAFSIGLVIAILVDMLFGD